MSITHVFVDDCPLGSLSGPREHPFPWVFFWETGAGTRPIGIWAAPGVDPCEQAVLTVAVIELRLRDDLN